MDRTFPLYGVELARLRNLSNEQQALRKIHFRLESDAIPDRKSPLDLYVPAFRQYGTSNERSVQHLDVTSTWRGLSTIQAQELKFWEDMFAAVLEYIISNNLIDIIDNMAECVVGRSPGDLDSRICDRINSMASKTFPVNTSELITFMLGLYKRHGNQYLWLASSGNIYNGICEFLRTRDCFMDTALHPTVKVSFNASQSAEGEPTIIGTVKRYSPFVGFSRLDSLVADESWCHVHPYYVEPVLDPTYYSCLARPEYRLASDCIKFEWDPSIDGFYGFVRTDDYTSGRKLSRVRYHTNSEAGSSRVDLDLTTLGNRFFPDGVRYERTLRVRIQLAVFHVSRTPTASPSDSLAPLKRCESTRTLFDLSVPSEKLAGLMRANKRGAKASDFSATPIEVSKNKANYCAKRDYPLDIWEHTAPHGSPAVEVHAMKNMGPLPRSSAWGKNVPAWSTLSGNADDEAEDQSADCLSIPFSPCGRASPRSPVWNRDVPAWTTPSENADDEDEDQPPDGLSIPVPSWEPASFEDPSIPPSSWQNPRQSPCPSFPMSPPTVQDDEDEERVARSVAASSRDTSGSQAPVEMIPVARVDSVVSLQSGLQGSVSTGSINPESPPSRRPYGREDLVRRTRGRFVCDDRMRNTIGMAGRTPEQVQTDIKEWYDAMLLKMDVEKSVGSPFKASIGDRSDEEAFEAVFHGSQGSQNAQSGGEEMEEQAEYV